MAGRAARAAGKPWVFFCVSSASKHNDSYDAFLLSFLGTGCSLSAEWFGLGNHVAVAACDYSRGSRFACEGDSDRCLQNLLRCWSYYCPYLSNVDLCRIGNGSLLLHSCYITLLECRVLPHLQRKNRVNIWEESSFLVLPLITSQS